MLRFSQTTESDKVSTDYLAPSNDGEPSSVLAISTKICTKCSIELPVSEFHKRSLSKDGLMSQCKECVNERIKNNYRKNPEAKIAKTRAYHLENPEWSKAALRKAHEKNREIRNQRIKVRLVNDEEFLTYRREVQARSERRRRALKIATAVDIITKQQYADILSEYNGLCWICEQKPGLVVWDHVHPLAKGGEHTVANLRPACGPCNIRKNALWPFTEEDRVRIRTEVRSLPDRKEVTP